MGDSTHDRTAGLSRRDFVTGVGAAALLAMTPGVASAIELDSQSARVNGRGVIFLVGDGMPLGVIRAMHEVATRVFKEPNTAFYELMADRKTIASYMGTASLSSIVTDSAPASVAWSTGSKTINGSLATLPDGTPLATIMEMAKAKGLANGLVTTTRVTHATPAAWVSHNADRDAENDIARDYFDFQPDVLLGGGSRFFDGTRRPDGRDLFAEFAATGYDVLRTRDQLLALGVSDRKIFGTFNSSHISYYVDRVNTPALGAAEPTLAEMTAVALNRLSRNRKGFVLQVEAGRIDHASHANDAWGALLDTYELDLTLRVIRDYVAMNPNTLLVITSDHGNSGWGVNGTGPKYNDATMALLKLAPITASLEKIAPMLRNKDLAQIKAIVAQYTGFNDLTDAEAQMIYDTLQPGFRHYGDYTYLAETQLGRMLAHSDYSTGVRRGNVGFTSNNHTAEDQLVLVYGNGADRLGISAYIDNTHLFKVMCDWLGLKHRNPRMSPAAAAKHIRPMSEAAWAKHMELHVR
ncbi:MAG: alkaline phosphatase [Coriobacteriia bacterium]|nr:alkaline phosphatase [Coriobacteriia bacterium]